MVWMFFLFLILAWIGGMAIDHTLGGLIHLLLVVAVTTFVGRVIVGRKAYLRSL
jgi:hypothetical protein